jgi:hypothetical protein
VILAELGPRCCGRVVTGVGATCSAPIGWLRLCRAIRETEAGRRRRTAELGRSQLVARPRLRAEESSLEARTLACYASGH